MSVPVQLPEALNRLTDAVLTVLNEIELAKSDGNISGLEKFRLGVLASRELIDVLMVLATVEGAKEAFEGKRLTLQ